MKRLYFMLGLLLMTNQCSLFGQCNLSINYSTTQPWCNSACDGSVIASAVGGTPPFTYKLDAFFQSTGTFNNVCSGNHTLIIIDDLGCSDTAQFTINEPPPLSLSLSTTLIDCLNAIATANVTGGTPPYMYGWSNGQTSNPTYIGTTGSYEVTLSDMHGCTMTNSIFVITHNGPIPGLVTSGQSAGTCGTQMDGFINLNLSGNPGPFTFLWNTGATTQNISNIGNGMYTVIIQDGWYCNMDTFYVTPANAIPGLSAMANVMPATCNSINDGFIDLVLSGNPGPFNFTWSNGATTEDIYSLYPGSYSYYIDDGADCFSGTVTVPMLDTCGSVIATLRNDGDLNCAVSINDLPIANQLLYVYPGPYISNTDQFGQATFTNLTTGSYYLKNFGDALHIPVCTDSIPFNMGMNFTAIMFDTVAGGIYDGKANTVYTLGLVPGFISNLIAYYAVIGSPASGTTYVVLDTIFQFMGSTPSPDFISGDTLFYNFSNLVGTQNISINVYIAPNPAYLGYITHNKLCVLTSPADINPVNNCLNHQRMITGSYDPNDKSVSPLGVGPQGLITPDETELSYLIRFQNTGNGPAVNVIIKDTLSDKLDLETFEMLGSSHPYQLRLEPNGATEWRFLNIMLPDSNADEPGSHGWIAYKIKQAPNNQLGDVILNTSYIFFDFNPPVITNTTINTVYNPLTSAFSASDAIVCVGDSISFISTSAYANSHSWDIQGGSPANATGSSVSSQFNTGGVYLVTLTTSNQWGTATSTDIVEVNEVNPAIILNGNTLSTGNFSSYQWYLNGIEIPGATGQNLIASVDGNYSVQVADDLGCLGESEQLHVNLSLTSYDYTIHVFPNPVRDKLYFELEQAKLVEYCLHGSLGNLILAGTAQNASILDLSNLRSGIYVLTVNVNETKQAIRIVKI